MRVKAAGATRFFDSEGVLRYSRCASWREVEAARGFGVSYGYLGGLFVAAGGTGEVHEIPV